jgi:F0F1-type ATP synthase membrane subunit c/vacuolar-type H+-ATPase subunit K
VINFSAFVVCIAVAILCGKAVEAACRAASDHLKRWIE